MKKLLLALALFLTPAASWAQCTGVFPANTICGSVAGGPPGPVSTSVLTGNPGGSPGQIQYNNSGAFGGFTASGDFTINTTTGAGLLASTAVTAGTYGDSTHVPQFTVDAKGRLTAAAPVAIAFPATIPPSPGGRLTLVSGQPEMFADVTSQNLYYAPDTGNSCPIYNGATWASYQFTASATDQVGLTLALAGSANWPAGTIFDVFCVLNGGVPVLATRAWDSSMLPTVTQISSNSLTTIQTGTSGSTWTNPSNAFDGTLIRTSTTSATASPGNSNLNNCLGQDLGVGISKVLTKVSLTSPTDTSFRGDNPTTEIISTYGSADNTNWDRLDASRNVLSNAGTIGTTYSYFINSLANIPYRYFRVCFTGNGTNSIHIAQIQFFTTAAPTTRRLTSFNGILTNDATMTGRISSSSTISVPVNQGTYLGSIQTDAATAGQVTANFGYGINRVMNIWNYYNRKPVTLLAGIAALNSALPASATFNYSLTWPAWQDWQGVQSSTSYSVQVLVGFYGDNVRGAFSRAWYLNGTGGNAAYEFGIGIDTTIAFSGSEGGTTGDTLSSTDVGYFGISQVTIPPFFGTHTLYGIERLTYSPVGTVQAFMNLGNTGLYVQTNY